MARKLPFVLITAAVGLALSGCDRPAAQTAPAGDVPASARQPAAIRVAQGPGAIRDESEIISERGTGAAKGTAGATRGATSEARPGSPTDTSNPSDTPPPSPTAPTTDGDRKPGDDGRTATANTPGAPKPPTTGGPTN